VELTIDSKETKVCWIRTPATRFGARVIIERKFVPHEVDPAAFSDPRVLGAEVTYSFARSRPSGTQRTCR
jgi:hypothetical protein